MSAEIFLDTAANALICGVLAVVIVSSWVWFVWRSVWDRRASASAGIEPATTPPGLRRLDAFIGWFEGLPFRLIAAVVLRLVGQTRTAERGAASRRMKGGVHVQTRS
jgi:hypothetical protein